MRQAFAAGCLAVGVALFAASLAGDAGGAGGVRFDPPHPQDTFDPRLAETTRSYEDLQAAVRRLPDGRAFDALTPEAKLARLHEMVAARFTNGLERVQHTVFTNWLMWAMGLAHPDLSVIRRPQTLLRHARTAYCSEISFLMMRLAEDEGIPARHVGLGGHVVMEAWYGGGWHMYDPNAEVIPVEEGRVLGVAAFIARPGLVEAAYAAHSHLLPAFRDTSRANFVAYPPGSQFVWKAQLLYLFEGVAEWLKYVAALGLCLLGWWGMRRGA